MTVTFSERPSRHLLLLFFQLYEAALSVTLSLNSFVVGLGVLLLLDAYALQLHISDVLTDEFDEVTGLLPSHNKNNWRWNIIYSSGRWEEGW